MEIDVTSLKGIDEQIKAKEAEKAEVQKDLSVLRKERRKAERKLVTAAIREG